MTPSAASGPGTRQDLRREIAVWCFGNEHGPVESKEPSSFHSQTSRALATKHCSEGAGRVLVLYEGRLKRISQDQAKKK